MLWYRLGAVSIIILFILSGVAFYTTEKNPDSSFRFQLGLDLAGGAHLVYRADTSGVEETEKAGALASLREVIERRVNLFGVGEPLVQVERSSVVATEREDRLIVELPGVTDVNEAVARIGETPLLEFRLLTTSLDGTVSYEPTALSGRYLQSAALHFPQAVGSMSGPVIQVTFTNEGSHIFEELTRTHVGEVLGIFLDGELLSAPTIQEVIPGGVATISGAFTPEEGRELARNLNFGALPVPIELIGTETIGSTLGAEVLSSGVFAGAIGFMLVILFMILWYRIPGVIAAVALSFYLVVLLLIVKAVPITLTAAGIAGIILSIGMAVDANVLIFERLKEELRGGKTVREAVKTGFARAWLPIRDGNASTMIAAVILFWFGSSLIEGFAFMFAIGVMLSMLTAISVTRVLLLSVAPDNRSSLSQKLFGTGFTL